MRDRALPRKECERLLFLATKHLRPILITARERGLRPGEILTVVGNKSILKGLKRLRSEDANRGRSRAAPISMAITGHGPLECFPGYDTISFADIYKAVGGV